MERGRDADKACAHLPGTGQPLNRLRRAAGCAPLQGVGGHTQWASLGVLLHFTAPKVRPWTNCFWLNQPNTTMGAMAISEAAESLAQNRPSGLE